LPGAADERGELVKRGMPPLARRVHVTRRRVLEFAIARAQAAPAIRPPGATYANHVASDSPDRGQPKLKRRTNQSGRHVALPLRTRKGKRADP
jgi:hypothetical protein